MWILSNSKIVALSFGWIFSFAVLEVKSNWLWWDNKRFQKKQSWNVQFPTYWKIGINKEYGE